MFSLLLLLAGVLSFSPGKYQFTMMELPEVAFDKVNIRELRNTMSIEERNLMKALSLSFEAFEVLTKSDKNHSQNLKKILNMMGDTIDSKKVSQVKLFRKIKGYYFLLDFFKVLSNKKNKEWCSWDDSYTFDKKEEQVRVRAIKFKIVKNEVDVEGFFNDNNRQLEDYLNILDQTNGVSSPYVHNVYYRQSKDLLILIIEEEKRWTTLKNVLNNMVDPNRSVIIQKEEIPSKFLFIFKDFFRFYKEKLTAKNITHNNLNLRTIRVKIDLGLETPVQFRLTNLENAVINGINEDEGNKSDTTVDSLSSEDKPSLLRDRKAICLIILHSFKFSDKFEKEFAGLMEKKLELSDIENVIIHIYKQAEENKSVVYTIVPVIVRCLIGADSENTDALDNLNKVNNQMFSTKEGIVPEYKPERTFGNQDFDGSVYAFIRIQEIDFSFLPSIKREKFDKNDEYFTEINIKSEITSALTEKKDYFIFLRKLFLKPKKIVDKI